MRESNFAFPGQNKACVCITSQLYDRRALDTSSSLPLFNSLSHLTYLTSTSARIREIMTIDGGLERLVRMLHEFCTSPPPPENPAIFYGLSPSNARPQRPIPTLNPASYDRHAAYRFTLAFQCLVNIGVRGSEPIRSRVVQAGTLEVVGCILEAWLASKGFAVGPAAAAGVPRETREQRHARRQALAEQRQRDEAAELARALHRQIQVDTAHRARDFLAIAVPGPSNDLGLSSASTVASTANSDTEVDTSTDASATGTPIQSSTPTGSVIVPGRERSGTIIARPVWDGPRSPATTARHGRSHRPRPPPSPSTGPDTDTSRPETETEDDGDVEMDTVSTVRGASAAASPPRPRQHHSLGRVVGIIADTPVATQAMDTDPHVIINDVDPRGGVTFVGDRVGVEDGLVSLETNDDFAMGAPPGAPGAIDNTGPINARALTMDVVMDVPPPTRRRTVGAGDAPPDATPRAGVVNLPSLGTHAVGVNRTGTVRGPSAPAPTPPAQTTVRTHHHRNHDHHNRERERSDRDETPSGPYRDEDVLLSLQLLAYLSKYPHVRQAFYKPRPGFHPASIVNYTNVPATTTATTTPTSAITTPTPTTATTTTTTTTTISTTKEKAKEASNSFFRAFNTSKSKEKDRHSSLVSLPTNSNTQQRTNTASGSSNAPAPSTANTRHTNVFSLVERFTWRPSSADLLTPSGESEPRPLPRLPAEIQYWAGVIMRNACRKDDTRGGIRQCANMLCGRWEEFPREFAKCRRCRKAKYCGKECQSTAWNEGHRFWCSAKERDDDATEDTVVGGNDSSHGGQERDREREARNRSDARTIMMMRSRHGRERDGERERERERDQTLMNLGFDTARRVSLEGGEVGEADVFRM